MNRNIDDDEDNRINPIDWSDTLAKMLADTILACAFYFQSFASGIPLLFGITFLTWISWDSVFLPLVGQPMTFSQIGLTVLLLRSIMGPPYIAISQPLTPNERAMLLRFETASLNKKHLKVVDGNYSIEDDDDEGA